MSDWDYINEHMGGHDSDGLPNFMSEPDFYNDGDGYKYYFMDDYSRHKVMRHINTVIESIESLNIDVECGVKNKASIELHGFKDGWDRISDVFSEIDIFVRRVTYRNSVDLIIFIEPNSSVLNIQSFGDSREEFKISVGTFYEQDISESDIENIEAWSQGFKEALNSFHQLINGKFDVIRMTEPQSVELSKHKMTIIKKMSELKKIRQLEDGVAIKLKLVELAKLDAILNFSCIFGSFPDKARDIDKTKFLVEIITKDNLMPVFKVESGDYTRYRFYEMSVNGKIISRNSLSGKNLKERYPVVNGIHYVPLLDFIKFTKTIHLKGFED